MNQSKEPIVSYSSSFEDVILYRALKDVGNGCYIDVGASVPLGDSNTALFYRQGWRGICLEPIPDFNRAWAEHRPDDVLLNVAAGATDGDVTFYVYKDTSQISTCSVDTMQMWKERHYFPDSEFSVPVVTLNNIMEKYLNGRTIHLLAIDVEGFEKQVLQGFDLKKYKPWIIIIESAVPGTSIPSYQEWESILLDAGYAMVYEDGINRFYLSDKKIELQPFFSFPPNVRDNFIPLKQELIQKKCEELELRNEIVGRAASFLRKVVVALLVIIVITAFFYVL